MYSETTAQIFQHAVVFDLVRDGRKVGLDCDIRRDIAASGLASFRILRSQATAYMANGARFSTWNDPTTPEDETVGTFMTLAFSFFSHVDDGVGVDRPLQRMMSLLDTFDESLLERYAPASDSVAADRFRATLMVAALSRAFERDLRDEFRQLGFQLDDAAFTALLLR